MLMASKAHRASCDTQTIPASLTCQAAVRLVMTFDLLDFLSESADLSLLTSAAGSNIDGECVLVSVCLSVLFFTRAHYTITNHPATPTTCPPTLHPLACCPVKHERPMLRLPFKHTSHSAVTIAPLHGNITVLVSTPQPGCRFLMGADTPHHSHPPAGRHQQHMACQNLKIVSSTVISLDSSRAWFSTAESPQLSPEQHSAAKHATGSMLNIQQWCTAWHSLAAVQQTLHVADHRCDFITWAAVST